MTGVKCLLIVLVCAGLSSLISACSDDAVPQQGEKQVIGALAFISVGKQGVNYLARIDTGASVCSVHAYNIRVVDAAEHPKDNLGKTILFDTINDAGEHHSIESYIVDVAKIRNAQGVEYRYEVMVSLAWKGKSKQVSVNLRDRSKMQYKLLIGRNWLKDDYVVDVSLSEHDDD
jgi:hypothetical protein